MNLADAVKDIWKRFAYVARSKSIELEEKFEGVIVHTDRHNLDLILANLLHNAVEYSPPNDRIHIVMEITGPTVNISFANTSTDLCESDLNKLFDRFYRKDPARTGNHAGLGLPLVRSLAKVLNLGLHLNLKQNRIFEVKLSGLKVT